MAHKEVEWREGGSIVRVDRHVGQRPAIHVFFRSFDRCDENLIGHCASLRRLLDRALGGLNETFPNATEVWCAGRRENTLNMTSRESVRDEFLIEDVQELAQLNVSGFNVRSIVAVDGVRPNSA